jgi:uncharacterized protein DUF3568
MAQPLHCAKLSRRGAPQWMSSVVCTFIAFTLSGCEPVSLTALGVGAAYGVQHTLSGISYRTFSAPLPQVRSAVMSALRHMDIKVGGKEKTETGERFIARATDREIEVELEAITPKTTRMRSTARSGFVRDAATATEIILQTERLLTSNTEVTSR